MIAFRHVLASTAAAASTLMLGLPAAAQPMGPVVVQQCTILQAVRTGHQFWYPWGPTVSPGIPVVDGIRIVYVNRNSVAANRVAFAVNYRGDQQHIVDVGTFSQGATIDHTFGNFSGDAYLGPRPNSCVVRAVRFADGRTWRGGGL